MARLRYPHRMGTAAAVRRRRSRRRVRSQPGCAGHAQVRGRNPPRIRAFALLDTTVDYHGIVHPLYTIVPEILTRRAAVTAPLLAIAKPYAVFTFLDELDGSD